MKKIVMTLAIGLASCSVFGQGGITFNTRGGGVFAPVYECRAGCQGLAGTNYLAQLYYGPEGESQFQMVPVLNAPADQFGTTAPPAWFGTGTIAGYILTSTGGGNRYTDPRIVAPGALTAFQIRVWEASQGRTWEEALGNWDETTRIFASSPIFTAPTSSNALTTPKPLTGAPAFCGDMWMDDTPDTTAPVVAIASPTNGQHVLTTDTTVNGTAYDPPGFWGTGVSLVEVRVNGGQWQSATGRELWSCKVRLVFGSNFIEVRCRDGFSSCLVARTDLYSIIESVTVTLSNHPPNSPANLSPPNGETNQAVALTLQAGGFADVDAGDTHAASQWLVRRVSDGATVFDSSEDTVNKTSRALPAGVLEYGTAYDWQVRFKDNRGAWSEYSAATMFSTVAPALQVALQGSTLFIAWPTNTLGFGLQYATNLPATGWMTASPAPVVVGGQMVVTNALTGGAGFYRLKKP